MYDVAVIGGGVVGCATLFELTNHGYRCVLLEKNDSLVSEASSGNSGMLHTGFDVLDDSIELDCIQRCQKRVFDVVDKLGVPVKTIGATMVAWNESQKARFPQIIHKSQTAGVSSIRELSVSELRQREPYLHGNAAGALWIPGEAVVDSWLLPVLLANDARKKRAEILLNARVERCDRDALTWVVHSSRGQVSARCVVNCAGLYGDIVDDLAGQRNFRIKPRKGQYLVFEKSAKSLINSNIVPVPTAVGKGVIVFRSVYDNVAVGPTAEDVEERRRAVIDDVITQRLLTVARQTVDGLISHRVVRTYTGVRPATQTKDYVLKANTEKNWVTVGGIRSTGVSGCLGLSERVHHLVQDDLAIEPSRGSNVSISTPEVRFTTSGTCIIDGRDHRITHPLTRAGIQQTLSRM